MSEEGAPEDLIYLAELEGLGDAHLVGAALENESIPFKVAANTASGFDVVIPRSWGMLYVARGHVDAARGILEEVRSDQKMAHEAYDPEVDVDRPPESEFVAD